MIDPEWDKAIDDDEKRVRLHRKYEAERLSQQAPTKAPKHCYLPAPIPEGKKPQDDLKYVYLSTDEDGRECKATWHSRTVEIDYGEFKEKELRRRQQHDPSVEIVTVYRKEVFTLQACGPIDEDDPESEVVLRAFSCGCSDVTTVRFHDRWRSSRVKGGSAVPAASVAGSTTSTRAPHVVAGAGAVCVPVSGAEVWVRASRSPSAPSRVPSASVVVRSTSAHARHCQPVSPVATRARTSVPPPGMSCTTISAALRMSVCSDVLRAWARPVARSRSRVAAVA